MTASGRRLLQRAWRERRRARGLCPRCGRPYDGPRYNCVDCRRENAERMRALRAVERLFGPWMDAVSLAMAKGLRKK